MNGIWIRTQNKKSLTLAKHIYASEHSIPITYLYSENEETGIQLGKYMTEQRASEVLDAIQERIIRYSEYEISNKDNDYVRPVFEMPFS